MTKSIIAAVSALVICVVIWGAYQYPKAVSTIATGSPAGSTFNTAKFAAVTADLSTPGTTGTTTSILNTDASDRYVTGARLGCNGIGTSLTAYTGAGLVSLTLTIGTSSTANANTIGATAKVLNAVVVPTSTIQYSFASSTSSGANAQATVWHANEYMNFQFNATNTAACTTGVDYISS